MTPTGKIVTENEKATPLPWRVERNGAGSHSVYPYRVRNAETGAEIGEVWRKASAHLICRSVNCHDELIAELELAADTFRDFSNVLRTIGKDVMSAAADVAERHIRERIASIAGAK